MLTEITSAIQSTKTALELVKAARGLSNYSELLTAVTEVQIKLTDAIASELGSQEKQAELLERIRELEKRLSEFENWDAQIQRYELFAFETKALTYALKPGQENGQPMHYLCLPCADKRQRSTLQPTAAFWFAQILRAKPPFPLRRPHQAAEAAGAGPGWPCEA
jgi:hypothetical protein